MKVRYNEKDLQGPHRLLDLQEKCDEAKPRCNNCVSTNRHCEGYDQRLLFDTDLPKRFQKREKFLSGKRNFSATPELLSKDDLKDDLSHVAKPSSLDINVSTPKITPASFVKLTPSRASVNNVMKSTGCPAPRELKVSPKFVPQSHFTDDALKSPLSLFFEGLLPSGDDRESFTKMPLDTALDDFLFGLLNEALFANKNELNTNFETELLELIGKAHVFDKGDFSAYGSSLVMSHQEENRMLGHFFQNLLPLLDAHPQSPWPALALRYCDYDVARSCFISLACIHIYESQKGGNEYYDNGIAHIHSTMKLLINSISESSSEDIKISVDSRTTEKAHVQSFVILVLINVHILFAVLEKGKSSLTRYLFKVFGLICQDSELYRSWMQDENKGSLVVVLSWYDTVSAMVSPDCRLPFCSPEWYGSAHNVISTLQMMGCPGEIFRALSEVCFLRHEIHNESLRNDEHFEEAMDSVTGQLFRYREYVQLKDGSDYMLRLKVAQCWSLAVYVSLLRLFKTDERKARIQAAVHEFIEIYSSIPNTAPIVLQMVWPIYAIGCECNNGFERGNLLTFMDTLYETAKMGTLASLRWIVKEVWQSGLTQEEVLVKWLEKGVDYLPL